MENQQLGPSYSCVFGFFQCVPKSNRRFVGYRLACTLGASHAPGALLTHRWLRVAGVGISREPLVLASGTITVCAVPCNSMQRHEVGRCGTVSGPVNLSSTPTVWNVAVCHLATSTTGKKKPKRS